MTGANYVVIHRMPKVAAWSLYHSLRASLPGVRIDLSHFLTPARLAAARRAALAPGVRPDVADSLRGQIEEAVRCAEEIDRRRRAGEPYCVISGYRDPLDQVVSQFFQGLSTFFPEIDVQADEVEAQAAFIEEKIGKMFRRLVAAGHPPANAEEGHFARVFIDDCLGWFDGEFKAFHEFDVFEHEPDELGNILIDRPPVRYLVYRQETLRDHFDDVLRQIPGVGVVTQVNENEAAGKDYAHLYRTFRKSFCPGREMLHFYYTSRYYRHFYRNEKPRFSSAPPGGRQGCDGPGLAAARLLRSAVLKLHSARDSARELQGELNATRQELDEARRLIAGMRATKAWRLRTLLRRVLHRPCTS